MLWCTDVILIICTGRQYGNALLGVRHQEEDVIFLRMRVERSNCLADRGRETTVTTRSPRAKDERMKQGDEIVLGACHVSMSRDPLTVN